MGKSAVEFISKGLIPLGPRRIMRMTNNPVRERYLIYLPSELNDPWRTLLKLLPPEKQQLCDFNMLQWNRLARIPMTVNYKDGNRARIIQPSVKG